jgi:hypothetical protein
MKLFLRISKGIYLMAFIGFLTACTIKKQVAIQAPIPGDAIAQLGQSFTAIPDSVQTSIYWYWMSDNMSEDGVIKDLEAMKKVGINRAFIGNIWQDDIKPGKVKIFSDEWWKILHAALKKATELNIQIGIFNSPGWSQSGGPWVKPEQAMRYLASSEVAVTGPAKIVKRLVQPNKDFQDVKVIAYPVAADYLADVTALHPQISTEPMIEGLKYAFDHDSKTSIRLSRDRAFALTIKAKHPIRSAALPLLPNRAG